MTGDIPRGVGASLIGSGAAQQIFHIGRFSEWIGLGEVTLGFFDELLADDHLIPSMEASVKDIQRWGTKRFDSIFDFRLVRLLLYIAVRGLQPRTVIETGVLHGMTSLFILRALERNGAGTLVSVDLPSYPETGPANKDGYNFTLPPGCGPGWLAPKEHPQWDLRLGSSRDLLPAFEAERPVDIFLHDSEHITSTMWFELNWAWSRMAPGGLLICDNIEANTAFADFCRRVGRTPIYFPTPDGGFNPTPRFAMIRN
jgi:predicted O-methyltransferase YrrM